MSNKDIRNYIAKMLSNTTVYYGQQLPTWIRNKLDAKAGDSVTVGGIPKRPAYKPYPHLKESYGVINHKRVYNGTLLYFDGKEWIQISGPRKSKIRRKI